MMSNKNRMSWDEYFMMLVHAISMKSKDESTHIGALIIDDTHRILTTGYNSFPSGIDDTVPERQVRPYKYYWFEHAERNCIYSAARKGIALDNSIMYTNGVPCVDCGRAVVQAGIKRVIYSEAWNNSNTDKWTEEAKITQELFEEAGVLLLGYAGHIQTKIEAIRRGVNYLKGE
jgi:dCMP deaminase